MIAKILLFAIYYFHMYIKIFETYRLESIKLDKQYY